MGALLLKIKKDENYRSFYLSAQSEKMTPSKQYIGGRLKRLPKVKYDISQKYDRDGHCLTDGRLAATHHSWRTRTPLILWQ